MEAGSDVDMDVEGQISSEGDLFNHSVRAMTWNNVNMRARTSTKAKIILHGVDGHVNAGEIMAILGPSGGGKTSLLNVLAHRRAQRMEINGQMALDGVETSTSIIQALSSYVEQEDALIGSLTVRETMDFAARLSLPSSVTRRERRRRVDGLIAAFGLQNQSDTIVGTPIRKGISGGQKRRLSIASALITAPKVLFLDEPTSGLDSTASYEVIKYLKAAVHSHKLIVIASIHQPSSSTFDLFDKLLLLSQGKTCYNGHKSSLRTYFDSIDTPIPLYVNPAEFLLDLTSSDFSLDDEGSQPRLDKIHSAWESFSKVSPPSAAEPKTDSGSKANLSFQRRHSSMPRVIMALLHRNFIKSYRDVVAYGIRFAMYIGLAIMMGTVWLRLSPIQSHIQPFINAIVSAADDSIWVALTALKFFGSAFMSFMAVAYVPAFLEDRATFIKERANGLYGASAFMISNFLIGIPYLFMISLIFSIITYFLINLRSGASGFFTWVMWLFLDLLAGESLVILMSSIFPNFVVSLALTAFANGLWMSVGGFLVSPTILNPFWKYVFHYIDYVSIVMDLCAWRKSR
ncbi:MAG: hypothetical protein Q9191_004935 [Dirinaria sp. TL-2023a]